MAKKTAGKKDGKKAGLIAFGATLALFALVFPIYTPVGLISGLLVSLGVSKVVKTMATPMKGLDKNAKARDELNVTVIEDEYARGVVEGGVTMLDALKKERDGINEYVFSRRIDTLRANYDQLLRAVIEDPGKASRIRKFNTYYLPTAVKVMQGYRAAKDKGASYMTVSATREDILNMLDDLVNATGNLLTTLTQDDLEDLDVEMEVFSRILKSDGLVEDELTEDMRQAAQSAAREIPVGKAPAVKPTAAPAPAAPAPRAEQAEVHEAPVLQAPVTATAAQMRQGAPVLKAPQAPAAPDFSSASTHGSKQA